MSISEPRAHRPACRPCSKKRPMLCSSVDDVAGVRERERGVALRYAAHGLVQRSATTNRPSWASASGHPFGSQVLGGAGRVPAVDRGRARRAAAAGTRGAAGARRDVNQAAQAASLKRLSVRSFSILVPAGGRARAPSEKRIETPKRPGRSARTTVQRPPLPTQPCAPLSFQNGVARTRTRKRPGFARASANDSGPSAPTSAAPPRAQQWHACRVTR